MLLSIIFTMTFATKNQLVRHFRCFYNFKSAQTARVDRPGDFERFFVSEQQEENKFQGRQTRTVNTVPFEAGPNYRAYLNRCERNGNTNSYRLSLRRAHCTGVYFPLKKEDTMLLHLRGSHMP